jgi:tyrosine-protein phosphatase SIW14
MKRARLLISAIFVFIHPAWLSAQKKVQPSTPSEMHSAYGEKLHIPGVPNAGKINEHLYRGEDPGTSGWEEKSAESLGIRFIHIPVPGWSPPTNEQVAQFLAIFRNNPQEKVFVHCRYGDDRTGVFVATYRMAFEKLPPDQALKEMYYFGFNGAWHPSMATFVRDFPSRLNTAPALVPFKNKE